MPVLTLVTEQALAPIPGGTGRYTRELGRALAVSAPGDWQLQAVTAWHREVGPARISGVAGPRRLPAGRRALARLWERGLPPAVGGDVVHATTPLAPMHPRLRRGRLVVTVHDAVPFTHPDLLTPHGAAWHRRMIEAAVRHADLIVVPSHSVARALGEHLEPAHLEVVGEGVSEAFARPVNPALAAAARRRFCLPERYLVAVGTLEPRKGLPTVARALRHLPTDVHLAVVGPTGWGEAPAIASDRVHLLGRLSDADLAAVVTGATVSVHASRSEGFGLPLVEAMAMGTPVVHTAIDVFEEVAQGAGTPFTVDDDAGLAHAVLPLLEDPAARERAVRHGLEAASQHTWSAAAARMWSLYRDLTAAR